MKKSLTLTLLTAVLAMALPVVAGEAHAATACDHFAAVTGNDANPGTAAAPVRTWARLAAVTGAGQVGCLAGGQTFDELVTLAVGGAPGAPKTIRSVPGGAAARVQGQLWIKPAATDIVFEDIDFVGLPGYKKATSLIVHGDRITFRHNDISNSDGLCLNVGSLDVYGAGTGDRADDFLLDGNRVHGCGPTSGVGAHDSGVHGVYLINTLNARLVNNVIYDNINRGIQLWPNAQQTLIEHNVLDGNGSNLNIGSYLANGFASRETIVRDNVITNSLLRSLYDATAPQGDQANVYGNFPANGDYGNVVSGNCVLQPSGPLYGGYGFTQSANTVVDPLYVDRAAKDFTLRADSPCAGKGPSGEAPVDPPAGPVATTLTMAVSRSSLVVGTPVTITGALRRSSGAAVTGEPIDVYVRPMGSAVDYTWLDSVTTSADGAISFESRPTQHSEFTLRFFARDGYASSASGTANVRVASSVSVQRSQASVVSGQSVSITGVVRPAGQSVRVQRYADGAWTTFATATSNGTGAFSVSTRPAPGVTSYRAVAPASTIRDAGVSATVRVTAYRAAIVAVRAVSPEYVDVRNTGSVTIPLAGWRLTAAGGAASIPAYSLAPGATVRVHSRTGTTSTGHVYLNRSVGLYGDGHDTARLVAPSGALASSLTY
jgi:parallel beta-helix repeat protein